MSILPQAQVSFLTVEPARVNCLLSISVGRGTRIQMREKRLLMHSRASHVLKVVAGHQLERVKDDKAVEVCCALRLIWGSGWQRVGEDGGAVAPIRGTDPRLKSEFVGSQVLEIFYHDAVVSEEQRVATAPGARDVG